MFSFIFAPRFCISLAYSGKVTLIASAVSDGALALHRHRGNRQRHYDAVVASAVENSRLWLAMFDYKAIGQFLGIDAEFFQFLGHTFDAVGFFCPVPAGRLLSGFVLRRMRRRPP